MSSSILRSDGKPADPKCTECGHKLSEHGFFYDGDSDCNQCNNCKNGFRMACPKCGKAVTLGIINQWGTCITCEMESRKTSDGEKT